MSGKRRTASQRARAVPAGKRSLAAETANIRGLIIGIEQGDGTYMLRPACFVVDTPRGFVWIEPSHYNEPGTNSAPSMHAFEGTVERIAPRSWRLRGNFDGFLEEYEPEDAAAIGDCMRWWLDEYLPASRKTIDELRREAEPDALSNYQDDST